MIEFNDINIKYDMVIIENISLKIKDSEFVSIIGPSGCGKSSLLKYMISESEKDLVGYMAQEDLLFDWYNVIQNVVLPLKINKKTIDIDKELEIFGLSRYKYHNINQLSGGLKSRVALLRAYIISNKLMLLDEPFSKLDYLTHLKIINWFKSVTINKSVVLVTHNIDEAILLSDRIIILSDKPCKIINEYLVTEHTNEILKAKIILDLK